MHNLAAVQENDTQTPIGIWHTNESLNSDQKTRPYNNQQKKKEKKRKRTSKIVDFAVVIGHRIKSKESKTKDKYLDLNME